MDENKQKSMSSLPTKKMKQTNWSDPRMRTAVEDWLNKGKSKFDHNGDEITSLTQYANIHGIPPNTLHNYCHCDVLKAKARGRCLWAMSPFS